LSASVLQVFTGIRPLGIGTALHHLAGSLIMSFFHNEIAQYLLPNGKFGIVIPGRTYFVIHSTQSLINQFLSKLTNSTHVTLLFDLINMFLMKSHAKPATMFSHPLHPSLLSFDILIFYILTTTRQVGYKPLLANGLISFKVKDSHKVTTLVSFLSPYSLQLLKQINSLLLNKCSQFHLHNQQQTNDDSLGSQSHIVFIVDNTSIALIIPILPSFFNYF
jgi:hypothetical protein